MELHATNPPDAAPPAAAAGAPRRPRWARLLLAVALMAVVASVSAGAAWFLRGSPAGADSGRGGPGHDGDLMSRGRLVYGVSCAPCHGPDGRGDGPSAAQLRPPPRDFAAGPWKYGTDRAAVRRVIAAGIPGTGMPASGAALSGADLDALVAYVLTLAPRESGPERLPAQMRALLKQADLTPADPARAAPALELRDTAGQPLALADLRGKVVLVQFWETTCVPCVSKLPHLERLADEYRERGLVVLAVCLDEEDPGRLRAVAARHVKTLPLYADAGGSARVRYDVSALPAACLIDRDGHLLGRGPGPSDWNGPEARALLDSCLVPKSPAAE